KAINRVGGPWTPRDVRLPRLQIERHKAAEADGRIPRRALINPGAEESDLLCGEARAFFGHDTVGIEPLNKRNQEALSAFARDNGRAGIDTFQQSFAVIESQAALVSAAAVAFDATSLENRFNLRRKIDGMRCGPGELRELLRGKLGRESDATNYGNDE